MSSLVLKRKSESLTSILCLCNLISYILPIVSANFSESVSSMSVMSCLNERSRFIYSSGGGTVALIVDDINAN